MVGERYCKILALRYYVCHFFLALAIKEKFTNVQLRTGGERFHMPYDKCHYLRLDISKIKAPVELFHVLQQHVISQLGYRLLWLTTKHR